MFSVALYLHDRAYGGPEEGGWYFDCYQRIDDGSFKPVFFDTEEQAIEFAESSQALIAELNDGRYEVSSVLSEGRYTLLVNEGYPPSHEPQERPYYE